MTLIRPFCGYRYNEEKIEDVGKVMTPPYDSIGDNERHKLYDLDKYNVVRVVNGLVYDDDTEDNNCYTRAKTHLSEWLRDEILVRDKKKAIYMYEQRIEYNHSNYSNRGFVVEMKLCTPDEKKVIPCEKSTVKNITERSKLISAVDANVSMINCMYIESEKYITNLMEDISERKPDTVCTIDDGTEQRLWVIDGEKEIDYILELLKDHIFFLIDGQTRYDIALDYAEKRKKENLGHTGDESYNYIMTLLSNAYDDGLMQVPFHRLLRFPKGFREDFFVSAAQDHFKIEKIIVDTELGEMVDTIKKQIATTRKMNRFAVYTGKNYFYRLTLTDTEFLKQIMPDVSDNYRSLDVTVLNKLILEDIFNICEDSYIERVTYTKSITDGIGELKKGTHQCMVCMNAVKAEQIRAVVSEGETMPERSMCVFPKPAMGVIVNKLD
ncbi:MAG: DUF1015 domain-containing protein [Eubacteriales bacterium]|nr:DUF1015 domain-containing protein [Eubacteriales bacterium]